jgi:DEAD/DEAH box helicase domain-containing protein
MAAEKNIVYFDLETRMTAKDVGGWGFVAKMGVSVAVTYSTHQQAYRIYVQDEVDGLIAELKAADLVVGFNHVGFDYEVLMGQTIFDFREEVKDLDMLVDLNRILGHKISLDAVASATLGSGKTADGLDAIRWWQQGKYDKIAEYCCYDVKVTKCVHEYGVKHGHVKYHNKQKKLCTVEVNW